MKFFRNLSIKNKLVSIVLLVSILSILVGFTIVMIKDINIFKEDLVSTTSMTAKAVGESCSVGLSFGFSFKDEVAADLVKLLKVMPIIENGIIFDASGTLFASYNKSGDFFEYPMPDSEETRYEGNYLHIFRYIYVEGNKIGAIYLRSSAYQLNEKINDYMVTMGLVMIGLICLAYFLAVKLQKVISKPILKLAKVTEDISLRADYSVRVVKKGKDEIGKLYEGFNNMLEQIQLREKERDQAEAEREKLFGELEEKNRELEQVVYVTSHDLRSPLVNIQGFSKELDYSLKELVELLEGYTLPDEVKDKLTFILDQDIPDSLKYIQTSASKMDSLLTGLLKLSRVGRAASTFGNIDMNKLMEDVQHAFEFQIKEQEAHLEIGDLPPCFGNEMQINQVFSNLVNNALKYLAEDRTGQININGEKRNGHVVYTVQDNGIGIAKEHQKKVFEIFHRLNPEDTSGEGLGLTIVNKIITRHNGDVWVESAAGKGSTFFVKLPAAD